MLRVAGLFSTHTDAVVMHVGCCVWDLGMQERERIKKVAEADRMKAEKTERATNSIPSIVTGELKRGPSNENEHPQELAQCRGVGETCEETTNTGTKTLHGKVVSAQQSGDEIANNTHNDRTDHIMGPEVADDTPTESACHVPSPPSYPPRLPSRPRPYSNRSPVSGAARRNVDPKVAVEEHTHMQEQTLKEQLQGADDFKMQMNAHTKSGDVAAIIAGMHRYRMDACIQKLACHALWILADEGDSKVGRAGAFEEIFDAMNTHTGGDRVQIEVQEQALGALWSLARHADNRREIVANGGGIRAVLDVMLALPSEVVIQERACGILWNLLECQECLLPETDVVTAVAQALRKHIMHAGVITQSCGALMSFARNYKQKNKSAQHDNTALLVGSIRIILDVMHAHPSHPIIQGQGCGSLMNLFHGSKVPDEVNCSDVTPVVLAALRTHPKARAVVMRGCGVLWSLAAREDTRREIVEDCGIEIICEALRCHASDADVQERACGVLWSLAANSNDSSVQGRLADANAADLIQQAMQRHAAHAGIKKNAQGALRCLARKIKLDKMPDEAAGV